MKPPPGALAASPMAPGKYRANLLALLEQGVRELSPLSSQTAILGAAQAVSRFAGHGSQTIKAMPMPEEPCGKRG